MSRPILWYKRKNWKGGKVTMDVAKIGMKVKIERVKKELTIEELASRANMSVTTISRLERGYGNPRMFSIQKIAEVLELDVNTLVE